MIRASVHRERADFTLAVEFEAGAQVTGVFGPSGAGKSRLMGMIAGLERPDRGSIVVDGQVLFDSDRGVDVPTHRRGIGVVFQEHRLFPHLSVEGNLRYGRAREGAGAGLGEIVELLELGPLLRRRVTEISGGERQRVALGRTLMCRPRLLLLDEPLASLDARLKQQIIPYLRRVRDASGVPMLYVSHDLTEVLQLTDRLLVMERGAVVGHGAYGDLVHDDAVLAVVHERGMKNLIAARVVAHDPEGGLTVLQLGAGDDPSCRLVIPICAAAVGSTVTIAVHPWDVALAGDVVARLSIQNQIRGVVTRCTLHRDSAIVEVDIGVGLIVEVSRRSAAALGIDRGRGVVCLIKSNAIRRVA